MDQHLSVHTKKLPDMACLVPHTCVGLEEHATFEALGDSSPFYDEIWKTKSVREDLLDKDAGRLAAMDAGHMGFQVLSQLPGMANERPDDCRKANNQLAQVVRGNPSRFAGFAALPVSYPKEAAEELERAITELQLVGAMIDSRNPKDMSHYDDRKFWTIFETAERLDIPIYIHPSPASEQLMKDQFDGEYAQVIATGLSTGAWGWHSDVGLHVVKLFAAGVFKEFPKLKIIVGHMGEMIPMMIDRIDRLKFFQRGGCGSFREVWERNMWVTTSGIFSTRTLEMLMKVTAFNRIMYSVDAPFEKPETGWRFLEELARSGVLTTEQLADLAYGNAITFLRLPSAVAQNGEL